MKKIQFQKHLWSKTIAFTVLALLVFVKETEMLVMQVKISCIYSDKVPGGCAHRRYVGWGY